MALDEVSNQPWTRKHDNPGTPAVSSAARIVYPHALEDLIQICSTRKPDQKLHAAGSHWALSTAAMSDHTFIETHDPNNIHQAMGKTLYDVIPNCMNDAFIEAMGQRKVAPFDSNSTFEDVGLYPVHIEAGKRVYQLYAELDYGETNEASLAVLLKNKFGNDTYLDPWAFRTLGGAGGQTVFGALHTGTHGADIHEPPITDEVMAIHLVADGGKHYWIEPATLFFSIEAQLTDDSKLTAFFGQPRFGGPDNFKIIRDDDFFHSVLVSAGRFGAVYSIVLAAVRQYTLHQERTLTTWQDIKSSVTDPRSPLYTQISGDKPNKSLQIAVCVTPHANFSRNFAGVTKRRNAPMAVIPGTNVPSGRPERVGKMVTAFDPSLQAPRFANAGTSHPYDPDPDHRGKAGSASFLEVACSDADFISGVLNEVIRQVGDFVSSNGTVIGTVIAVAGGPGSGGLLALLAAFPAILDLLKAVVHALGGGSPVHFGKVLDDLRSTLLGTPDPAMRTAGLFVWQAIAAQVFSTQQGNSTFEAISYAVMDGFDYLDRSCNVNVQSIEVFFDATDANLIAFVDALLAFEIGQEINLGHAFVGYISLRFTGKSRALLGMSQFPINCAIEVAGLADAVGTKELIDYAVTLALSNQFGAIMHWGQRNESNRAQIQARFGDPQSDPNCPLARWRKSLSRITNNGQLNGFSSAFTRQTGLEEN